jgi:hypothetical protein
LGEQGFVDGVLKVREVLLNMSVVKRYRFISLRIEGGERGEREGSGARWWFVHRVRLTLILVLAV